jgi:hypothetical protein
MRKELAKDVIMNQGIIAAHELATLAVTGRSKGAVIWIEIEWWRKREEATSCPQPDETGKVLLNANCHSDKVQGQSICATIVIGGVNRSDARASSYSVREPRLR